MKRASGHAVTEVPRRTKRAAAHRRKALANFRATRPYKLNRSAWELHALLTAHLKQRGFASASFIALRILSEGVESGLLTVLLAFHLAVDDARVEWCHRVKRWP